MISSAAQRARDHDHRAVAAGQVEGLVLRARPDEVEHAGGDEQHRGLDERELAPGRAVERASVGRRAAAPSTTAGTASASAPPRTPPPAASRAGAPGMRGRASPSVERDVLHVGPRGRLALAEPLQVPVDHRAHGEQQVAHRLGELARELGRDRAAQRVEQRRRAPGGRARRPRPAAARRARCSPSRAAGRPASWTPRPGAAPPARAVQRRRGRRRGARARRRARRRRRSAAQAKRTTSSPSSSAAPAGPERGQRGREHDRPPPPVDRPPPARRRPS